MNMNAYDVMLVLQYLMGLFVTSLYISDVLAKKSSSADQPARVCPGMEVDNVRCICHH